MNSFGEILIVELKLEKNNFFENSSAIFNKSSIVSFIKRKIANNWKMGRFHLSSKLKAILNQYQISARSQNNTKQFPINCLKPI
jgi:hypothetical protein